MANNKKYHHTFDGLLRLAAHLRGPDGCPWDRDQTSRSMRSQILEECYELLEAIDEDDTDEMLEELGDVIFHLAFQVVLAEEKGTFTGEQVFGAVIDKLVRRHPHVFGDAQVAGAEDVLARWQDIKRAERTDAEASALDGVPKTLPALSYAQILQERAARAGFDWDDVEGVLDKVMEELDELRQAHTPQQREDELGDLLFSIVNAARWMDIDAETALRSSDARFRRRFAHMEKLSRDRGIEFPDLTMDEKEALWQEVKAGEGFGG